MTNENWPMFWIIVVLLLTIGALAARNDAQGAERWCAPTKVMLDIIVKEDGGNLVLTAVDSNENLLYLFKDDEAHWIMTIRLNKSPETMCRATQGTDLILFTNGELL